MADARPDPSQRHHRQAILPEIGSVGQEAIGRAHAWVVGCGALGCAAADQLVRAGVGRLTLVDRDVVELTNLQRQSLFTEADVLRPKASAAAARLRAIDSQLDIRAHDAHLDASLVHRLADAERRSVIVDGTDNFETRYLLNDAAVSMGTPMVYAGVIGSRAMSMAVVPGSGPCLRCIEPVPPAPGSIETCDTAGVLAAAVQVAASMQVVEALRLIVREGEADGGYLVEQDVWKRTHRRLDLRSSKDAACPCCGRREFAFLKAPGSADAVSLCGRGAVQIMPPNGLGVDLPVLRDRLDKHGRVVSDGTWLRCEFEAEYGDGGRALALMLFQDGRALVRGTSDLGRARAVYDRYVGR